MPCIFFTGLTWTHCESESTWVESESKSMRPESESTALESEFAKVESESTGVDLSPDLSPDSDSPIESKSESGLAPTLVKGHWLVYIATLLEELHKFNCSIGSFQPNSPLRCFYHLSDFHLNWLKCYIFGCNTCRCVPSEKFTFQSVAILQRLKIFNFLREFLFECFTAQFAYFGRRFLNN